jgi:VanZ family protein
MLQRIKLSTIAVPAFWLCVIGAVTFALLPHPPATPFKELGDKFQHMFAFATLALIGSFAFPGMSKARLGERLSFLGALVEVAQSIPALHRDCDMRDWIADTLAIVVVLVVLHLLRLPRGESPD